MDQGRAEAGGRVSVNVRAPFLHKMLEDTRKLPNPQVHKCWSLGKSYVEVVSCDYQDVTLALDQGTWHEHNKRFLSVCDWHSYREDWFGRLPMVPGVDENDVCGRVRGILHVGVPEDVKKLEGLAEKVRNLLPPLGFGRRKRRFGREGDELDIDRWLDGKEEPWVDYNRSGQKPSPYITLVGQFGGNCNITPEQMFWTGSAAAALTDALENVGFRVRLIAANKNNQGSGDVEMKDGGRKHFDDRVALRVIELKGYDEPLRLGPVAFAVCHAGFFRTIGFGMILNSNIHTQSGLGSSRSLETDDTSFITNDAVVILPVARDLATAKAGVEGAIADLKTIFGLVEV